MGNEFKKDVQRIVGVKRDTAEDTSLNSVGGIASQRGVATQSAGARVISYVGSEGGEDGGSTKTDDNTTPDDKDKTETPDPTDQDSNTKGSDSGVFDAADLLDGTDGPVIGDGEGVSTIEAIDCASGLDLEINLDGYFRPIEAFEGDEDRPPNAEWTDPLVPPDKLGFELGKQWQAQQLGYTPGYAADPFSAAELGVAGISPPLAGVWGPYSVISIEEDTGTGNWDCVGGGFTLEIGGDPTTFSFSTASVSCTPGSSEACPLENKETQWPEDGKINLIFVDGKFQTSQYDSEATPQYSGQETSHINFCMEGGRTGTLRAGKNGGTVLYETSSPNGPPLEGKDVIVYNQDGVPTTTVPSDKVGSTLPEGDTV